MAQFIKNMPARYHALILAMAERNLAQHLREHGVVD